MERCAFTVMLPWLDNHTSPASISLRGLLDFRHPETFTANGHESPFGINLSR